MFRTEWLLENPDLQSLMTQTADFAHAWDLAGEAAEWLQQAIGSRPRLAITLGTGGGQTTGLFPVEVRIPYREIPHFMTTGVESHAGEITTGVLGGVPVICLSGRFHYYEGWSMAAIVHPVRTMARLGCEGMIITNAAGGLHPDHNPGDLVLLRDHINLMPDNPLRGVNDERMGPRFPDMMAAYDPAWRQAAHRAASHLRMSLHEGVYAGLAGPNLETPAEYLFLHRIGADLVGMSTVPEVIAARHCGMRVAALSVVSNVCYPPERISHTTHASVIDTVAHARQRLYELLTEWVREIFVLSS